MGKSREIKKRMKAVGNIRRITRTMQMIATAKFSAAQQRATAGKPYAEALFGLVAELAGGEGVDHPLLREPAKGGRELTLLITSDRGLCGPYNGSLLRTMLRHLREHPVAAQGDIEVVGKKGAAVLKFNKVDIARQHTHFGDKPALADIHALANAYIDRFISGEVAAVRVVSMRYVSAGKQVPEVRTLLPFSAPARVRADEGGARAGYTEHFEFSPAADELLGTLLPAAVRATLVQVFSDAIVSEHVARMVAMKAATDNAAKMGKRLTRDYNRARQAQITTELTEIISGAAALG